MVRKVTDGVYGVVGAAAIPVAVVGGAAAIPVMALVGSIQHGSTAMATAVEATTTSTPTSPMEDAASHVSVVHNNYPSNDEMAASPYRPVQALTKDPRLNPIITAIKCAKAKGGSPAEGALDPNPNPNPELPDTALDPYILICSLWKVLRQVPEPPWRLAVQRKTQ